MPKDTTSSEPEFGSNELTLERAIDGAAALIEKIEEEQAKIDAVNQDAKERKAPHSDEVAKLKKQCRDDFNIEAKALATVLTKRRQERRMQMRIEALKQNAREQFDMFEQRIEA